MPWKVSTVSETRRLLVSRVLHQGCSVAAACREFGVSRKTAYKWIQRWKLQLDQPLENRSRRPHHSPARQPDTLEAKVIQAHHDHWGCGARKIHAILKQQGHDVPSVNTLQNILRRNNATAKPRTGTTDAATGRFERSQPNELWQMDFKGPLEVARAPVHPLTLIDDHSRYLLCIETLPDHRRAPLWDVLWLVFERIGMPDALLCDNEFSTRHQAPHTISWFDSQLLRLQIRPLHGRFNHPQTQGKVERIHRTYEQELIPRARRDTLDNFIYDTQRWRDHYNHLRPHEALQMTPPAKHWKPSNRARPAKLPDPYYPDGATLRKVGHVGDIRWNTYRINVGRGLTGQNVGVIDQPDGLAIYYCDHRIRLLKHEEMTRGHML